MWGLVLHLQNTHNYFTVDEVIHSLALGRVYVQRLPWLYLLVCSWGEVSDTPTEHVIDTPHPVTLTSHMQQVMPFSSHITETLLNLLLVRNCFPSVYVTTVREGESCTLIITEQHNSDGSMYMENHFPGAMSLKVGTVHGLLISQGGSQTH